MPSSSPQVTEMELTSPIERVLTRLNGIVKISSKSGFGNADVSIELDKWTDPEMFRFEAATVMRQLHPKLPSGSTFPKIYLNRPGNNKQFGQSIIGYTLNGPGTVNDVAILAEKIFRPAMAPLKGVYKFDVSGGKNTELVILEDAKKMSAIGLSHSALYSTLSESLKAKDHGIVEMRNDRFNLTLAPAIGTLQQLNTYPVATSGGRVFTLNEVASISIQNATPSSYYRINGENMVTMSIYPEEHVNTIKLASTIKNTMSIAETRLPKGYRLTLNYDNTEYIKQELNKVYLRTFLSITILLVFVLLITWQVRYMFIVITSLMVNVLLSFIFYYLFKLEIHLYSLAGITISLGLIIDNVIVIIEDIRHTGRNQIFAAIFSSTLTALGALSVIFLLSETQRVNLIDFAIGIIINLVVSLPIAYFFIPAMVDKFPIVVKKRKTLMKRRRKLVLFSSYYRRQLQFMILFRRGFLLLFILLFGLPMFLLPERIEKNTFWANTYNHVFGNDFYNQVLREPLNTYLGGTLFLFLKNRGRYAAYNEEDGKQHLRLNVNVRMPNGATINQMNKIMLEFENYLKEFDKELENFTSNIISANSAQISISFKKEYAADFPYELKELLESKAMYSGAADFDVYGVGEGFSNAINLEQHDSTISLKGYDYNELQSIARQISKTLYLNPRIRDIVITTAKRGKEETYPEYIVDFTRPDYLAQYNIGRRNMGEALKKIEEDQTVVGNLLVGGETYIPVRLASHSNDSPEIWKSMHMPLQVDDSTVVKLGVLSDVKREKVAEHIIKENQTYLLNVHYQFIGSEELNSIVKDKTTERIRKILPFGYSVSSQATTWWGKEDGNAYLWFIPLVLFIIYIICAVLLESLLKPLAVVLMIPFSFIGVFLMFHFLGLQFDQGGYAALLLLAGLVTNAALYILNDFNIIKHSKQRLPSDMLKLYVKAYNAKAIPILITTISAILSLLPFMLNGEDKGFWFTLSAGTIGGLLFSVIGVYLLLPICLLEQKNVIS